MGRRAYLEGLEPILVQRAVPVLGKRPWGVAPVLVEGWEGQRYRNGQRYHPSRV